MMLALLLCAAFFLVIAPPAQADQVCRGLDSGKIDTKGDPASVTVTAPEGQLIDGYCVKAGSANQGEGPEYVTLNPPVGTITITHTSGKDVSHYSVSYVGEVTDACKDINGNQPKGTNCARPETTVTSTENAGTPDCAAETVTVTTVTTTTTYSFDDATGKWVGDANEKITTSTRPATAKECPDNTTDVCENIDGDQATVPAGQVLDGTNCVKPAVVTPPGETPPGDTPPVVVTPPSQGGVVVPPAAGGPKPGQGVGNTPGHSPGTVTPGASSNYTPGTVVVSTPETVGVPTEVAAGLGAAATTASGSATTMSLFGGLLFMVAGLLLSRRRVR